MHPSLGLDYLVIIFGEIMKSFIVFIVFIVSTSHIIGQENQNIRICKENVQLVIVANKHLFRPANVDSINNSLDINYCNDYETIYFLDSLEISEEIYLKEDLLNNVTESEGFYILLKTENDKINCVSVLKLFLNIKIPIFLNNAPLDIDNKKQVLAEIKPENLLYVEKKNPFLRRTFLDIKTK